ncbi:unnamed protein product [Vicia faba]|uniref:Uncharacterized protein n=1 Tax=Vicia faba TaxID=3906 RepID=A0AAV0YGC0_VICFA|nr:unnamed protein product [Vicia faba]
MPSTDNKNNKAKNADRVTKCGCLNSHEPRISLSLKWHHRQDDLSDLLSPSSDRSILLLAFLSRYTTTSSIQLSHILDCFNSSSIESLFRVILPLLRFNITKYLLHLSDVLFHLKLVSPPFALVESSPLSACFNCGSAMVSALSLTSTFNLSMMRNTSVRKKSVILLSAFRWKFLLDAVRRGLEDFELAFRELAKILLSLFPDVSVTVAGGIQLGNG